MVITQQDFDVVKGEAFSGACSIQACGILPASPIDVGAGVGRIHEDGVNRLVARPHPGDRRPAVGMPPAAGDLEPMVVEEVEDRRRGSESFELREDRPNRSLDFLIGIELDLPVLAGDITGREPKG